VTTTHDGRFYVRYLPTGVAAGDPRGLLVFTPTNPKNAYFAFHGAKYQVEVYDPSGNAAGRLVLADKIVPVS
jgi:hypothetical protein